MKCNEFERWLNKGEPERDRQRARKHAAGCARCGRALGAALVVEEALRSEAAIPVIAASPGFVASVMNRVEVIAERTREVPVGRPLFPWWARLATDPMSVVSVTLGISLGVAALWNPQWLLDTTVNLGAHWWWLALSASSAARGDLDPVSWLSIGIALAPLAAWGIYSLYRRLERTAILIIERPGR